MPGCRSSAASSPGRCASWCGRRAGRGRRQDDRALPDRPARFTGRRREVDRWLSRPRSAPHGSLRWARSADARGLRAQATPTERRRRAGCRSCASPTTREAFAEVAPRVREHAQATDAEGSKVRCQVQTSRPGAGAGAARDRRRGPGQWGQAERRALSPSTLRVTPARLHGSGRRLAVPRRAQHLGQGALRRN